MPTPMNWLRRWYKGKYIPPEPLDDDDCQGVVVVNVGHHQRHWSARLVAAVVDFVRQNPRSATLGLVFTAVAALSDVLGWFLK